VQTSSGGVPGEVRQQGGDRVINFADYFYFYILKHWPDKLIFIFNLS
jgi:hypothetical protein